MPRAPEHGPLALTGLFALSVLVALIGAGLGAYALRVIGALGVLFFGIGAAPMQLSRKPELPARLGLTALIGLTVAIGVGALMADIRPLWQPVPAAVLFVGVAAAIHLRGAHRAFSAAGARPDLSALRDLLRRSWGEVRRLPVASLLLLGFGTELWFATAVVAGHIDPGVGGFIATINPLWFVGVVLVLLAIPLAGEDERMLCLAVMSLTLATTLTPALVYGAPRSQAAAKQIELVQLILHHHHIVPGAGIYQAYSAFFAGIAWLCRIAGVTNPFGLATYWPVVLAFVRVAELRFLIGRLVLSRSRRWIAVALVVLVDSIGADYFSPQSVGYVMVIALVALTVKGQIDRPLGPRSRAAIVTLASLALAPTHELSPYMAAGVLFILACFRLAPYWAVLVTALPAAAWAGFEHKIVGKAFSFSQVFSVSNFAPPHTVSTPGLHRMSIVGLSSHALLLGLLILIAAAGVGFLRNVRSRWAWAYGLCPAVGLGFIAINPYGNEGIFRAALFAIPWLSILAVRALPMRQTARPSARAGLALFALLVTLLATFVVAAYGMDGSDVMRRTDLDAGRVFAAQAPTHSFILTLGYGDNPVNAPLFDGTATSVTWDKVVTPSMLRQGHPVQSDMTRLTQRYEEYAQAYGATTGSRVYVLWSYSLLLYSEEYGLQTASQTRTWLRLLQRDPEWHLVYHRGRSYLFQARLAPEVSVPLGLTPLVASAPFKVVRSSPPADRHHLRTSPAKGDRRHHPRARTGSRR